MRFQRFGDRYIVRLESGESIIDTLTEFLRSERVEFAKSQRSRRCQLGAPGLLECRDTRL